MLGTLSELAQRVDGRVDGDASVPILRISAIEEAGPDALTFATTAAYLQQAARSRAGAILTDATLLAGAPAVAKPVIAVANVRVALAALLRAFDRPAPVRPFRHPTAIVEDGAWVGERVHLGPQTIVRRGARIGDDSVLDAACYVGEGAHIGAHCRLAPRACVLDGCVIGDRVMLFAGCVIGSEGFGYVFVDGRFERIPQVGNVVLGNDVEIGANTCVDRAQTGSTRIGDGTKVDNLCQIGHNSRIGAHCGIAAQTGLAGSTILGDNVLVGGQAGFKGHITIGSRVKIGGGSAVWSDIPDDAFVSGRPARPHGEELRREVMVRNLPKLVARVDALEKRKD